MIGGYRYQLNQGSHQAERDSITTLSWQRYTFLVRPVMWIFVVANTIIHWLE